MNTGASGSNDRVNSHDAGARRSRSSFRWLRWVNGLSAVTLVGCLLVLVRTLPVDRAVQALQGRVDQLGALGPVAFAAAYVLAGLLFVPGSALTLASGAMFGLLWGTAIVSIASTITAALAFLIARYLARASVQRAAQGNARFAAIDRAIGHGGWRVVALLRLSPAVPFSLGNYLYGLTSIRFWPYVLASWICMLPGTFMYVYIGHLGAQGLQVASGSADSASVGKTALLIVGLMAMIVVTIYVTRLARRALAEQGAFAAEPSPRSEELSTAAATGARSGLRTVVLPITAVVLLAATIAAWTRQDALQGLFGPPTATLQEAYSQKTDGVVFNHSKFDSLLRKHVSEGGWVDYAGLKSDAADLDAYIASLEKAPFDQLGRDEKLALLINAYNAFTLRLILDHFPVKSIKEIPDLKRWADKRWNVAGNTWSLNQIEHEQIRPKFREPRVHFALVCAAIGCPPLRSEAYTGAKLEGQFADQTRYVHTHERWFQFDPKDGVVRLTKLYDWYGDDFKQVAESVVAYAAKHSKELQAALDSKSKPRVEWLDYDWRLNSRENKP
jgi:uncharacterized membrane protein YdjX (TVP38/TMEM64 family)